MFAGSKAVNVVVGVLVAVRLLKLASEGRMRTTGGPTRTEIFAVEMVPLVELLPINK
jgi:hypothetical protein